MPDKFRILRAIDPVDSLADELESEFPPEDKGTMVLLYKERKRLESLVEATRTAMAEAQARLAGVNRYIQTANTRAAKALSDIKESKTEAPEKEAATNTPDPVRSARAREGVERKKVKKVSPERQGLNAQLELISKLGIAKPERIRKMSSMSDADLSVAIKIILTRASNK